MWQKNQFGNFLKFKVENFKLKDKFYLFIFLEGKDKIR